MTREDIEIRDGWCCCHHSCGGVAVPCIVRPGHAESCVRCVSRLLGLPEDTHAGAVVAELLRRDAVEVEA